jgi:Helix-turn-helix domain
VDDEILTIAEAGRLLRMTEKQVYELCRRRSQERSRHPFPAFNIHAKAKRIRKSDLMAWIETLAKEGCVLR